MTKKLTKRDEQVEAPKEEPLAIQAVIDLVADEENRGNENFFREAMEEAGRLYAGYIKLKQGLEVENSEIEAANLRVHEEIVLHEQESQRKGDELWNKPIQDPKAALENFEHSNTLKEIFSLLTRNPSELVEIIDSLPKGQKKAAKILNLFFAPDRPHGAELLKITTHPAHVEPEFLELVNAFARGMVQSIRKTTPGETAIDHISGSIKLSQRKTSLGEMRERFRETNFFSDPEDPEVISRLTMLLLSGFPNANPEITNANGLFEVLLKLYNHKQYLAKSNEKRAEIASKKRPLHSKEELAHKLKEPMELHYPNMGTFNLSKKEFDACVREKMKAGETVDTELAIKLAGRAQTRGLLGEYLYDTGDLYSYEKLKEQAGKWFAEYRMSTNEKEKLGRLEKLFSKKPDKYAKVLFNLYEMARYFHTMGKTLFEKGATESQKKQGLETTFFAVGITVVLERMVALLETRLAVSNVMRIEMGEFTQFAEAVNTLAKAPLNLQVQSLIANSVEQFRAALEVERIGEE